VPKRKKGVFLEGLIIPNTLREFFAELSYLFPQNEGNCRGKKRTESRSLSRFNPSGINPLFYYFSPLFFQDNPKVTELFAW